MLNYTDAFITRFWAKVDRRGEGECWLWLKGKSPSGPRLYGVIGIPTSVSGRPPFKRYAHDVSYELSCGEIPAGCDLDHSCHQTLCVNPGHLRLTSRSQNMQNRTGLQTNNTSGYRGVTWDRSRQKWVVQMKLNYKGYRGGRFDDLEEAAAAAIELRNRLMTHNDADRGVNLDKSSGPTAELPPI